MWAYHSKGLSYQDILPMQLASEHVSLVLYWFHKYGGVLENGYLERKQLSLVVGVNPRQSWDICDNPVGYNSGHSLLRNKLPWKQPCGRYSIERWRHQMEIFSALLAFCVGNSPVTGEFPPQRPVTRPYDVFFDLHLNNRISNPSWGRWFETPSRLLWRHCNGHNICCQCCFFWLLISHQ